MCKGKREEDFEKQINLNCQILKYIIMPQQLRQSDVKTTNKMESPYIDPSIHMLLIYAEGSKSNH